MTWFGRLLGFAGENAPADDRDGAPCAALAPTAPLPAELSAMTGVPLVAGFGAGTTETAQDQARAIRVARF